MHIGEQVASYLSLAATYKLESKPLTTQLHNSLLQKPFIEQQERRNQSAMANSPSSILLQNLIRLSQPLKESLSKAHYTPPETYANVSVKSKLLSLLPDPTISDSDFPTKLKDFALCCAALTSASNSTSQHLSWLPNSLSISAASAFKEFSNAYYSDNAHAKCSMKVGELELDLSGVIENEKKLLIELMPEVLPSLKDTIKESAVDASDESDGVSAASARAPVAYAVLAAYQLGWIVRQVDAPYVGKLCPFMIPCSLIALDHWSPEVKGQGMISFIHLARNANAEEIGGYADAILDACCQNIASDDDIWHYVVEMSVLLVALILKSNPHSSWYEKLLGEMLNHLERQPRNKQRRVVWLTHCEPLLDGLGLVLLAHFRRLFPLFFKWMHADDDETVLLVLERMIAVVRLTWIRNSPHIERLVDELVTLYKDAALKVAREDIRLLILQILKLIQTSKRPQLDATWLKYKDDPNITALMPSLS
ncbi:ARM repeat superfamily protein [Perilla frutescens var. hirtella]|nr:ARM repeat superfamily protein [Perilla frutescens var. hirtella]KAH6805632.1 ARM repeat superfamily protein [Perilla frutescens var. frutescens]